MMNYLSLLIVSLINIPKIPAITPSLPVNFRLTHREIAQLNYSHPQLNVKVNYYPIHGKNIQQIRDSLRTGGIIYQKDGKRYAGLTLWNVAWHYYYQQQGQQCQFTQVTVNTTVTITLPQWQMPSNAPDSLQNKWNQFSSALRKHEETHKQHGVLAGQEILTTLRQFPPSSTCPELQQKANQTANNIISKYNQADLNYDQHTQHGRTEGAVF